MVQKVTIIGGSGFIGTRLVERLTRGDIFDCKIIDKNPSEDFNLITKICDVRHASELESLIDSDEILINLAAEHRDDVKPIGLYYDVNVRGAEIICNIPREKKIKKIIFTSSVAVYGFSKAALDESSQIKPSNEYGRTKWLAEEIFTKWQREDPEHNTLVIVRPTVVFGERNRGNVYNLMHQVASGRFAMIGDGLNKKSMAYVENVAAFLEYSLGFQTGIHIFNYVDKPDFTMNNLISHVNYLLGRPIAVKFSIPRSLGLMIGFCFDLMSTLSGKKFPISFIRIKKFTSDSVYHSAVGSTGFVAPISMLEAIEGTIRFEFIEDNKAKKVFYSE